MPRTARQTSTSGIYHIMLRGINRQASPATMGAAINQLAEFMLSTIETHHRPKLSASI